jgi:hypothetical protein
LSAPLLSLQALIVPLELGIAAYETLAAMDSSAPARTRMLSCFFMVVLLFDPCLLARW